jgi:drug/metabolite transporter (DMT)-like permease
MKSIRAAIPVLFVGLWATGFIGARYAMPHAEPFVFLALRFLIAAMLLGALAALAGAPWPRGRSILWSILAGVLIHGVYLGAVFWAIHNGMPAGLSALIIALQPILTAILAARLVGEIIDRKLILGLVLGLLGVTMVMVPSLRNIGGATLPTYAACFLAVVGMSIGTIIQKQMASMSDLRTGTFWQYVGATALMALMTLLFEEGRIDFTRELLFALAWLVVVLSLAAIFLLMLLIRNGAVSRVATLFYLVPGTTAVLAWLLFDETLTPFQIAGLLVTTLAVRLASASGSAVRARRDSA